MNLIHKIFGNNHTTHKEETKMTNIQKALELINTFADGDKVFLQTVYNFAGAGEQVAFYAFPMLL